MPNRLAHETSPYLQQHADNPVDWYPWGEEALRLAREQNKPILLSVGYSACHWCHVMAHESFEDPEIAALMNRLFVNIKVDREERPDLDQIYQSCASHAHPAQRAAGRSRCSSRPTRSRSSAAPTFRRRRATTCPASAICCSSIAQVYREQRDAIAAQNEELVSLLGRTSACDLGVRCSWMRRPVTSAVRGAEARSSTAIHGGLGGAPKFPHPASSTCA